MLTPLKLLFRKSARSSVCWRFMSRLSALWTLAGIWFNGSPSPGRGAVPITMTSGFSCAVAGFRTGCEASLDCWARLKTGTSALARHARPENTRVALRFNSGIEVFPVVVHGRSTPRLLPPRRIFLATDVANQRVLGVPRKKVMASRERSGDLPEATAHRRHEPRCWVGY